MKIGIAGSLESNDALITVKSSDKTEIIIESIVYDFFYEQGYNMFMILDRKHTKMWKRQ